MGLRVLALLWNPGETALSAGGFRRTYEILKRFEGEKLVVVDASPSYMKGVDNDRILLNEYRVPRWIKSLEKRAFVVERLLEWGYSIGAMVRRGWRLRREYDVIYNPHSELMVATLPALILKWLTGKPIVFCNLNTAGTRPGKWLQNVTHKRATLVMTISHDLSKALNQQGIKRKMPINYTGLDVDYIERQPKVKKEFDAIFVGRHVPTKGVDDYLRMLPLLVKAKPDFQLVSIGSRTPEMERHIEGELKKMGLTKHWKYCGVVTEEEKYRLIGQAKTMWFLSTLEGWGIVPQEALACGTLPLCYDLPVYNESIADCSAATFAPMNNWQKAADLAIELLNLSDKEKERRYHIGREFVQRFDWGAIAKREYAIIAKVL